MQDATVVDVIYSLVIGGLFGWVTGGLYNLLNGKRFSGKAKETAK